MLPCSFNRQLGLFILLPMMDGVLPTLGFAERFVFSSVFTLHANERVDCLLLLLHRSIKSSSEASGQQKAACLG